MSYNGQILACNQHVRSNPDTHSPADRMPARSKTDRGIKDQVKNLHSIARPHDEGAFGPLDTTAGIGSPLALAIYIIIVFNLRNRHTCPSANLPTYLLVSLWRSGTWTHMNLQRNQETIGEQVGPELSTTIDTNKEDGNCKCISHIYIYIHTCMHTMQT